MRTFVRNTGGVAALYGAPLLALAQIGQTPSDLRGVAAIFLDIFAAFVPVVIGLALVLFLWGLAKFLGNADSENARTEGKNLMIWGVIGLFVMVSVWGLVQILTGTFGVGTAVPFFPAP